MIYEKILDTGTCPDCGEAVERTIAAVDAHLLAAGVLTPDDLPAEGE